MTGKNFIVDPRVRAQVTMLSTAPMSPAAFYEAFLAILQVHGFIAVPSGSVIKIMPDATARQVPANDLPDRVSSTSDEIVTQVVQVRNVSAGPARPDPPPDDAAVGAPRRLPQRQHADHLGPRLERQPDRAHRPADRPHGRRRFRGHPARARLRVRDRARHQLARRRARRRRGGRFAHCRRRTHEQRAGERRAVAAPALPHAHYTPRYAARGRRRHTGPLPALCRCREARRKAQGTIRCNRRCRGRTACGPGSSSGAAASTSQS